jgi:hypothetical protein
VGLHTRRGDTAGNLKGAEMDAEKRKEIRYPVQENIIAALQNGGTTVGKVRDVSKGGLSLEYIIYDDESNAKSKGRDIFIFVNGFSIRRVPCRVVYDIPVPMPESDDLFITHLMTMRCGVKFEALSGEQKEKLEYLLQTYAKPVVL